MTAAATTSAANASVANASGANASAARPRPRHDQSIGAVCDLLDGQREMLAELQAAVDDQRAELARITAELRDLRSFAARGQRELLQRLAELHGRPSYQPSSPLDPAHEASAPTGDGANGASSTTGATEAGTPLGQADYARLVIRVRALVRTMVPGYAVVAVVSRGDDALIDLDGRTGWHFPRCDDGRYAGHHPRDSESAVAHLEELRRKGARYLVIPATALWWLDHYRGLHDHLEQHYRLLVHRADACAIFALDGQESAS